MRVQILYPPSGPYDAIATHGRLLADQLATLGIAVRVAEGGVRRLTRTVMERRTDWVLLQYNPYSFGRWGFAPLLVAALALARLLPGSPRVAVMLHEAYSRERSSRRNTLMGLWQREQLRAILRLVAPVFVSTEENGVVVRALAPGTSAIHLPIPATVRCAGIGRADARDNLGIPPDALVLTLFGGRHPSRALGHAEAAVDAVTRTGRPLVVLNLGADPPDVVLPHEVRAIAPGPLDPIALSRHLAATDVALVPFTDGVSTRRTTLTAALAHGLTVVGTDGERTDDLLRAHPDALVLTPVAAPERFAAAVAELADDPARRARTGQAARRLYETTFDWPVVGRRLVAELEAS